MAESEDKTSKKMKKTTEHGQILMTVENLFRKCQERKEMVRGRLSGDEPKNFDDMQLSGENAIDQLKIIK